MPEEYFKQPTVQSQVFGEIAAELPYGYLRTYWEEWATVVGTPKNDPVVAALIMMGTATIAQARAAKEMMDMLKRLEALLSNQPSPESFKSRVEGVNAVSRKSADSL